MQIGSPLNRPEIQEKVRAYLGQSRAPTLLTQAITKSGRPQPATMCGVAREARRRLLTHGLGYGFFTVEPASLTRRPGKMPPAQRSLITSAIRASSICSRCSA